MTVWRIRGRSYDLFYAEPFLSSEQRRSYSDFRYCSSWDFLVQCSTLSWLTAVVLTWDHVNVSTISSRSVTPPRSRIVSCRLHAPQQHIARRSSSLLRAAASSFINLKAAAACRLNLHVPRCADDSLSAFDLSKKWFVSHRRLALGGSRARRNVGGQLSDRTTSTSYELFL